jgi:hypothetical protein
MRDHTFPIGLSVRLKDRTYISPGAAETYRITAKLPLTSNCPSIAFAMTNSARHASAGKTISSRLNGV